MLEAIGKWSKPRQLWTLTFLYSALVALVVRITSDYGECIVACPRLDKFISHYALALIDGVLHHDPLALIFAAIIIFGTWELIGYSNQKPRPVNQNDRSNAGSPPNENRQQQDQEKERFSWRTPITGFVKLGALEKFTAVLVVIGYFQCWALIKTDHTIDRQNETTKLRDRAFVYFEGAGNLPYPNNEPVVWGLFAKINNTGNIAARDLRVRFACPVDKKNDRDPFEIATKWFDLETPNVIGPKQNIGPLWLAGCDIPISVVNEAGRSESTIYMALEASYFDGFEMSKRRVTQMGRAFRFDRFGGMRLGFAGQNCSDEGCSK